jgi:hypothetical protein
LLTKYPWIKHRIIDLTNHTLDFFASNTHKFDWIYKLNNFFSPNNACRDNFAFKIKDWADIINSGKKLCIVWGKDKPRVLKENGKFCVRFLDLIDDAATVTSISGQSPYVDEFFYWSPSKPEIIIKQGHLIKNYLSVNDPSTLPFVSLEKSDLAYTEFKNQKYWLSNHGIHKLIYPRWDISTWSFGKPPSIIVSLRDTWFYNISDVELVKKNFDLGLAKLVSDIPDYWKNDPTDFSKGIKLCWSKNYFLE